MMEFDELKKIWDTQNEQVMYAINEDTLYKRVMKKNISVNKIINKYEIITMIATVVTGVISLVDSIVDKEEKYTFIAPVVMIAVAGYVLVTRIRRKKNDNGFNHTLLDTINRSISAIEFQVNRLRQSIWWMIIPISSIYCLSMYHTFYGRPLWVWFLLPVWLILMYFGLRWEINKMYLPQKRELENLRELLTSE